MKDPYQNLPIGDLQSVLPEPELAELDFLWRSVIHPGEHTRPLLFDKKTLALLYRCLTTDRIGERGFRTALIDAMDDHALRAVYPVGDDVMQEPVEALRARLHQETWVDSDAIQRFVDAIGLPRAIIPKPDAGRSDSFICSPFHPPLRPLLDYQIRVHDSAMERLAFPNVRLVIQMPTGSGKTLTAMNIVSSFLMQRRKFGAVTRILWLAHAEELCEQALESFTQIWSHIGVCPVHVVRAWKNHGFPGDLPGDSIVIATFQKAYRALTRKDLDWKADLVLVDEAHRAPARTYLETIEEMLEANGRVLGLTATPGRAYKEAAENELLADLFGGEIIGLDFGDRDAIRELQAREVLSMLQLEDIDVDLPIQIPRSEWRRLASDRSADFSPDFLKSLTFSRHRNVVILKRLLELLSSGERILYFAPSVAQSRIIVASLLAAGASAAHIDGETSTRVRRSSINDFRQGRVQLLSNFGVLSTGFDAPQTSCVFIGRPTTSIVLYSQMIGRGLRGPRLGGSPLCRLVQVKDKFSGLPFDLDDIYSFFAEYWTNGQR